MNLHIIRQTKLMVSCQYIVVQFNLVQFTAMHE